MKKYALIAGVLLVCAGNQYSFSQHCDTCLTAFNPEPGKTYLFSAWVKEAGALPTKTSYTFPQIVIGFPSVNTYSTPYTALGTIIDGWQKIDGQFTVPSAATDFNIRLQCASGTCYFDDIRIFPSDGSMKTYVYDPITLRLSAELDENNYATFYEYDEEGKLTRVKKETEKGIMTIKENRSSSKKK